MKAKTIVNITTRGLRLFGPYTIAATTSVLVGLLVPGSILGRIGWTALSLLVSMPVAYYYHKRIYQMIEER